MTDTRLPLAGDASRAGLAFILATAAVAAVVLNTVVAAIAHAAGASDAFTPLKASSYISLTLIGFLAGIIGWIVIRARAKDPARMLRVLVPAVLLLSFVPDLAVGFSDRPGSSWGAVAALAVMHVIVTATVVIAGSRSLPTAAKR